VPPCDKSDSKTNGRSTEPPRRSRRATALMVAATTAVLLSASVLWYRTHSGAIADDTVAQPSRTSPLTLDPAAFAGQAREAYQIARSDPVFLAQLHCYCGCDKVLGHRNLLDCFRSRHAASCGTCIGETLDGYQMRVQGSPVEQIRDALRARYEHAE
jgi:hypothetical protein